MNNNQKRVGGALFERQNPNGPAFSGFVEIDGVKTHIALWSNTSKAGQPYLGVTEDVRAAQRDAQKAAGQGPGQSSFRPGTTYGGQKPRIFTPRGNQNITTGSQGRGYKRDPDLDD